MQISFEEPYMNTNKLAKEIVEDVLCFIDNAENKRKDLILNKLKKKDENFINIFNALLKRNAIVIKHRKVNGHSRSFFETANRNAIYYALFKIIDVPKEEDLKNVFLFWKNNSNISEYSKSNIKDLLKFEYIKSFYDEDAWKEYLNLEFRDFRDLTSFCFCFYDLKHTVKHMEPNPSMVKKDDVVYLNRNPTESKNEDKNLNNKIIKEVPKEDSLNKENKIADENTDINSCKANKQEELVYCEIPLLDEQKKKEFVTKLTYNEYSNFVDKMRMSLGELLKHQSEVHNILSFMQDKYYYLFKSVNVLLSRDKIYKDDVSKDPSLSLCGVEDINIILSKIIFDIEDLKEIKQIIDTALSIEEKLNDIKNKLKEIKVSKQEFESVKRLVCDHPHKF